MRSLTHGSLICVTRCGLMHLLLIGVLAGCSDTPAGTPQATLARAVVSTSPASAAVNVSPVTTVNATFAEAVDGASLSNATFTLRDPRGVVDGAVLSDGATATLTPTRNLSLATPYTATLSATVTDAAGVPLGADYSWGFTTRDGMWGTAQLIETENVGGDFSPQVAVDPAGNALAAWEQRDGARSDLWATRLTPGTGWGTAERIKTDNTGSVSQLHVAVDPSGNVLAVWVLRYNGELTNIWANRLTPDTGWGTAQRIGTGNTGGAYSPRVAVDSSGNALAVWIQLDGTRYTTHGNRFTSATGWGTAQRIGSYTRGGPSSPQVAVDPSGNGLAIWHQTDGGPISIWANRFSTATGWGTAELLTPTAYFAFEPRVAVDPQGNGLALWYQVDDGRTNIWANRFIPATGWGTAQLIETDNAGSASWPTLAVDSSGSALAVWEQSDGTRDNIWANRFTPATGWGIAQLIETDNAGNTSRPQVAVDPRGNALAVWVQSDGTRDNIWANRFIPAIGWGTAQLLETDNAGDASSPQVAVDSSGNALAIWSQFNGTRYSIFANRFE